MLTDEVCIIGCGPSAMMIGLACEQYGYPFFFVAPKEKSHISGAQYLHRDVGLAILPKEVRYVHYGTERGYETKVYGSLPPGLRTSWGKFQGTVEAWPLIQIYEQLWDRYAFLILDMKVNLMQVMDYGEQYLTFNTAPLPALMPEAHYETEEVWITDVSHAPDNTIVYNGVLGVPEYRSSNLFGHTSTEYPGNLPQPPGARRIRKPLRTDAFIPNVHLSGRYGRWEKGVLVDESYFQAVELLTSR